MPRKRRLFKSWPLLGVVLVLGLTLGGAQSAGDKPRKAGEEEGGPHYQYRGRFPGGAAYR